MSNTMFKGRAAASTGPAMRLDPVTPRDDADLPRGVTRSIYVGVAGAVAVRDAYGTTIVLNSVGGQYHPLQVARVLATGTTASGIVALY